MERIESKGEFKLTNDGELDIFFIGVGSALTKVGHQTNFLIVKGEHHIMVDYGRTAPEALLQVAGLQWEDLQVLLPTHSHCDHVGGIGELALYNRYVAMPFMKKPKLQMIVTKEYQDVLWERTLRGALEWNEETVDTGQRLSFGDFFDVVRPEWKSWQPRETYVVDFPEDEPDPKKRIHLELFRTNHVPEQRGNWADCFISHGLFVEGHVFLSCDTKYDPALIEFYAPQSDVMFHDVQFFPGAVHAPLENLREFNDSIKAKMLLKHYGDNFAEQDISGFAGWAEEGLTYRWSQETNEALKVRSFGMA